MELMSIGPLMKSFEMRDVSLVPGCCTREVLVNKGIMRHLSGEHQSFPKVLIADV
jgi:hypothetical protein